MLLNSKLFNQITFFLSSKVLTNSLEEGAKVYGGATKLDNTIYSNVEENNNIKILDRDNSISLFVPSTLDTNNTTDNTEYTIKYLKAIRKHFKNNTIVLRNTNGSWYSDNLQRVIIEDISIIEVITTSLTIKDINFMLNMGLELKKEMSQESVSVTINDSLCLV